MTIYEFCVKETQAYRDRDAYISDLSLSTIWKDNNADIPSERVEQLGKLYDAANMTIKDISAASGLSVRALARRFVIPIRTAECWSSGENKFPLYTKLMMLECLGLFSPQKEWIDTEINEQKGDK